jgi:hypothetical protein
MRVKIIGLILVSSIIVGCGGPNRSGITTQGITITETPHVVWQADTEAIPTFTFSQESEPEPEIIQPTSTPASPSIPISGIEIQGIDEIQIVQQAGMTWVRRNGLLWSEVESIEGRREWEQVNLLEQELIAISGAGMRVILVVRDAPEWAQLQPGISCGAIKPDSLLAFAAFLHDAVERYSQPPYNVHYWELWNEPDVDPVFVNETSPYGCWGDLHDYEYFGGAYYAEMLKVAYPQIKAADPQAQVVVGGLLLDCDPVIPPETSPGSGQYKDCTSSRFLEGVLTEGGGEYFDGVSFHAYDYYQGKLGVYSNTNWHSAWNTTGPVLIAKTRYLRGMLAAFGYPNKFIMNTENGLLCGRDGTEPDCLGETFQDTKASYLVQSYVAARVEGLTANIWYDLRGWRGSGLLDAQMQPLEAFEALRFQSEMLDTAAIWGLIPQDMRVGVRGYTFYRAGIRIWVIWRLDEQLQIIEWSQSVETVFSTLGMSLPTTQEIRLSIMPIYLVWAEQP